LKDILKNKKGKEELVKSSTPLAQPSYIQKYYRKPGMSTTAYKENKIGRHI